MSRRTSPTPSRALMAVLRRRPSRAARAPGACAGRRRQRLPAHAVAAGHRATRSTRTAAHWVRALGEAGWLRHAVGGTAHGGAQRRARHAHAVPAARDAGRARRPGRLRVRDAGPGQRRDLAGRHARAEGALPAARGARRGDRGVRAVRARRRLRRRRDGHARRAATATRWVLDGEKTWISNGGIADFYVVFARQVEPGAAPRRAARGPSRPSSSMPTRRASRSPSAST